MNRGAARGERLGQRREIDMRGEVGSPGASRDRHEADGRASPAACRRARWRVAVVDDQRRTGCARQPLADVRGRSRSRAGANSMTSPSLPMRRRASMPPRPDGRAGRPSRPITRSCHCPSPLLELADRDRIEELVGDEDHRPVRHVVEASCQCGAASPSASRCRSRSTGLVSTRCTARRSGESRGSLAHGAQDIRHQRAAARAQFDQLEAARLAHRLPGADGTRRRSVRRTSARLPAR